MILGMVPLPRRCVLSMSGRGYPVVPAAGRAGIPSSIAPAGYILEKIASLDFWNGAASLQSMEIRPTPDQEALIRHAIDAGRISGPEQAGQEALALWEERERARSLADFRKTLDDAEASVRQGEGIEITRKSMRDLAEEVGRNGRARRATEKIPKIR